MYYKADYLDGPDVFVQPLAIHTRARIAGNRVRGVLDHAYVCVCVCVPKTRKSWGHRDMRDGDWAVTGLE